MCFIYGGQEKCLPVINYLFSADKEFINAQSKLLLIEKEYDDVRKELLSIEEKIFDYELENGEELFYNSKNVSEPYLSSKQIFGDYLGKLLPLSDSYIDKLYKSLILVAKYDKDFFNNNMSLIEAINNYKINLLNSSQEINYSVPKNEVYYSDVEKRMEELVNEGASIQDINDTMLKEFGQKDSDIPLQVALGYIGTKESDMAKPLNYKDPIEDRMWCADFVKLCTSKSNNIKFLPSLYNEGARKDNDNDKAVHNYAILYKTNKSFYLSKYWSEGQNSNDGKENLVAKDIASHFVQEFGYIPTERKNPKCGDLIFFVSKDSTNFKGTYFPSTGRHIGRVLYSDENKVYVVHGNGGDQNYDDGVCITAYDIGDKNIAGYGDESGAISYYNRTHDISVVSENDDSSSLSEIS